MFGDDLKQLRLRLGFENQEKLADALRLSQQTISYAERKGELSPKYRERMYRKLIEVFGDSPERQLIEKAFANEPFSREKPALTRTEVRQLSGADPMYEPPLTETDEDAQHWIAGLRDQVLLDRMAHIARCSGLETHFTSKPRYGLVLREGTTLPLPTHLDDILFPRSGGDFDLSSGTIVLLGSPLRHGVVGRVLRDLLKRLKVRSWFYPDIEDRKRRPCFLGYWTAENNLHIDNRPFYSQRFVDRDNTPHYVDYGLVAHGPLAPIVQGEASPFGDEARDSNRIVCVCGAHRFASGAGMRLVEDAELRRHVFDETVQFSKGRGAVAFKIVVKAGHFPSIVDVSVINQWGF